MKIINLRYPIPKLQPKCDEEAMRREYEDVKKIELNKSQPKLEKN